MEFECKTSEEARLFAGPWLKAWTGNNPEQLVSFYSDDAFYSDPGVPNGINGRENILSYFKKLLSYNPDWIWTHSGSVPLQDGFLNKWHASIPVGDVSIEIDGVCSVQIRDGLIYSNEVYFDRAELLAAIDREKAGRSA